MAAFAYIAVAVVSYLLGSIPTGFLGADEAAVSVGVPVLRGTITAAAPTTPIRMTATSQIHFFDMGVNSTDFAGE